MQSDIIVVIGDNIETTKTVDRSPATKQILVLYGYCRLAVGFVILTADPVSRGCVSVKLSPSVKPLPTYRDF